jgi:hypothetical protein
MTNEQQRAYEAFKRVSKENGYKKKEAISNLYVKLEDVTLELDIKRGIINSQSREIVGLESVIHHLESWIEKLILEQGD